MRVFQKKCHRSVKGGKLNTRHSCRRHSPLFGLIIRNDYSSVRAVSLTSGTGNFRGLQKALGVFATRAHLRRKKRGSQTSLSSLPARRSISPFDESQSDFAMRKEPNNAGLRKPGNGGPIESTIKTP